MRKLKKFKRFGAGGGPLGDESIMTDEEYAKQKEQGAKNWESIKNFFGGRRSADEPSAPIEERDTSRKTPEPVKAEPVKAEPVKAEPAKTSPVKTPSVAQQMKDREKGGPNEGKNYAQGLASKPDYESYTYGPDYIEDKDVGKPREQSFKFAGNSKKAEEYRQSLMPVNKPKPKPPTPAAEKTPAAAAEKTPAAAKAPRAASPDEIPGTDVKTPYEGEKIDNRGLAGKQLAQSTLGATAVGRGLGAGIRGAMGLGRMFESAPRAEGKGTGKFPEAKPEIEVSTKPAVDRLKEANIQGPPKPPRQETPAEKMGLRETPAMERARQAGEKAAPKAKSATEEMGLRDTPSMVRMRRQKEIANNMGPPKFYSKEPKPTVAEEFGVKETGPMERARKAKENFDEAADTARKAKPVADDEVVQEAAKRAAASRPRVTPKRQEDSAKFGGGKGTPSKAKTKAEVKPTSNKLKNPVGEKEGPTVDKVLKSKDLEAKKGGKIPAFKKGGLVGRADGCAIRGKTRGRMV
jgi:hypothetical protein